MIALDKNHISLTSAKEVGRICKPLLNLGINTFVYIKNYKNNQVIHLSNRPEWLEHYYQKSFYKIDPLLSKTDACSPGFILWNTLSGRDVYYDANNYFNISHGIVLAKKSRGVIEYYLFGGQDNKTHFINTCINNLDLLERFTFYFKNAAYLTLRDADKQRIIIPGTSLIPAVNKKERAANIPIVSDSHSYFTEIRDAFIRNTKMTSNKSVESKNNVLSGRELEVVYYFLQDKTAAEIGDAMNISKKTIEWHLSEIRKKLKCFSSKILKAKLLSNHFDWDEIMG